jgi:hypothetical protein
MTLSKLARNVAARMREIDSKINPSLYRELGSRERDRSPRGDDYNYLWDTLLDEFHVAGFDLEKLIGGR